MRIFLALCLSFIFATSAEAQNLNGEHITLFDVKLELLKSGDVRVRETITIKDAPDQSRRGIFRELPAKKFNADFDVVEDVNYTMQSITREGRPEKYLEQKLGNAWQWRIGDANTYLPNGEHTYSLTYHVENEIRYREKSDILMWNVTGNYWNYPVAKARVRVSVPESANIIEYTANTGRVGEGGQNFTSAAAASRILKRTLGGDKAIISTLISLAGKGWVDMKVTKKTTTLSPQSPSERKFELLPDEATLYKLLYGSNDSAVRLAGKPNSRFNSARAIFEQHINKHYSKDYHRRNAGWIIIGIVLSVIGVVIAASQINNNASSLFGYLIGAILLMNVVFLFLMPAPTKLGQSARADIEGFQLYMETAEKERFNAVEVGSSQEPPMTKERYEAFLPYAIALDVEKPWTKYFEKTLPTIAKEYRPSYAHGSGIRTGRGGSAIGGMNRSLVKNLSTGVQSAQPVSTSSSGGFSSGGGGGRFSGGGGGGGGGGSW